MHKNQKGFSLIELLIVVAIIGIIAAIAIPNLMSSRRASNESAAIATMRTVSSSEATYAATNSGAYGTMANLATAGVVDSSVGSSTTTPKSGYKFTASAVAGTATQPPTYDANGNPVSTSGLAATGKRYFGVTENGVIYQDSTAAVAFDAATRAAGASSTPVNQ